MVELARADVAKKKKPAALPKVRFEKYHEGLSAQIMHFGPFKDEGPTIARLHEFIESRGHQLRGQHHEIYLSDPRRTAPEKLKTVIRQPMTQGRADVFARPRKQRPLGFSKILRV